MSKKRPPKPVLPPSAFTARVPEPVTRDYPKSLIDSHIHVWNSEIQPELPWLRASKLAVICRPNEISFLSDVTKPFRAGESVDGRKWLDVARKEGNDGEVMEGWIHLQAEATHGDQDEDGSQGGWDHCIKEIDLLCQMALSTPNPLLIGIVPWAPVQHGRTALEIYVPKLHALPSFLSFSLQHPSKSLTPRTPSHTPSPIKGFRYWLDFVPPGFMLEEKFLDGLVWLGEKGYTFDIDVDVADAPRGAEIMEEVVECIKKVREAGGATKFILDHLAKPPLSGSDLSTNPSAPFGKLVSHIFELSLIPDVYLKLSGQINCVDPGIAKSAFLEFVELRKSSDPATTRPDSLSAVSLGVAVAVNEVTDSPNPGSSALAPAPIRKGAINELKKVINLILEPCLESFGDSRIVFGSDWPIFKTVLFDQQDNDIALERLCWEFEVEIFRSCLVELGVEGEGLDRIFAGNAKEFYGL